MQVCLDCAMLKTVCFVCGLPVRTNYTRLPEYSTAGFVTVVVYYGTNLVEVVSGPLPTVIAPVPLATQARVVKPTDQQLLHSTTLTNDSALLFVIAASESWEFEFNIYSTFDSSNPSGLRRHVPFRLCQIQTINDDQERGRFGGRSC